ncbi:hypothetical protein ACHAWO_010451 [Cyclotella atomus]|uniref:LITAF domain-containing protein n=1 Tax=Cyclotella atomus TaxID=382360 RepID=A0ABD3MQY2_9STRA
MAESNPTTDVETGTPTPEEVSAALNGVILGRSFPVTLPECPYCKKKNVMTVLDTHATSGTYIMCVFLGIISALILWWIPLVLDSCKKTDHKCSKCEKIVGSIEAFSDSSCCKCLAKKPSN